MTRLREHRVEAAWLALRVRPEQDAAQNKKSERAGGDAGVGRGPAVADTGLLKRGWRQLLIPDNVLLRGGEPTRGSQVLQKLSDRISECLTRAEECTLKAEAALTEDRREDFLRLAQSWMRLAESCEFADLLLDFAKENNRRRTEFYDDGQ
jgi:hypothetical protein